MNGASAGEAGAPADARAERLARLLRWAPLGLLAAAVAASVWALPRLPERIPTHWGLDGRPTNRMPSDVAAFLLPGIMLHLWLLLGVIGWSLRHTREGRALPAWTMPAVTAATVALLLGLHLSVLAHGLGWPVRVPVVANLGVGALFAALGYVMRDVPPNPVFGVRTPRTLRDEHAWRAATMLAAPLPGPWPLAVLLGSTLLAALAGVVAGRRAQRSEATDG